MSFTRLQHALGERLSVEGVRWGVEEVAQDDGAVHDVARWQYHRISHQSVHQRVYYSHRQRDREQSCHSFTTHITAQTQLTGSYNYQSILL